jgi:hypothetical protein
MRETKTTESESTGDLQPEIARLRARVEELQAELARKPGRGHERDSEQEREPPGVGGDLPERAFDEGRKLFRGLTLASVEQLRLAADLVSQLGDEVLSRNRVNRVRGQHEKRAGEPVSPASLVADLPRDFFAGVNSVIDESLKIPGKVVEKFYEAYKETESVQRSSAERELSRAANALSRAEHLSKARRQGTPSGKMKSETETPKAD